MSVLFGIVFILIGLFFMTPQGAAMGLSWNRKHENDRWKSGETRAKTAPGVRLTGVVFVIAGIAVVIQAAT